MPAANLAKVFGPILLKDTSMSMQAQVADIPNCIDVVEWLIVHTKDIFSPVVGADGAEEGSVFFLPIFSSYLYFALSFFLSFFCRFYSS
jgi:hypothetical protein